MHRGKLIGSIRWSKRDAAASPRRRIENFIGGVL